MNTDFRLSVGFWQHPKTKKTARRLGLEGIRSLQILWAWAAVNRPDGSLSGMDWEDIELAADWQGEEQKFFDTCLGMWIEETSGGYALHDWQEHNPWASEADTRSDAARLSRFARKFPDIARAMREDGVKGLTQEEYRMYADGTPYVRRSSSVDTALNERSTERSTPAPSPALRINTHENTTPDGVVVDAVGVSPPTEPDSGCTANEEMPSGEILKPVPRASKAKSGAPSCPHKQIVALYHEILPTLPRVKVWDSERERNMQARWRERWESGKYATQEEGLAYWRRLFAYIHGCPWLMGEVADRDGKAFRADLGWIILPRNFKKIIEGRYDQRQEVA